MSAAIAFVLASLSYAALYRARARPGWRSRGAAIVAAGASAWAFEAVEPGGGWILAILAWTLAASLVPVLHGVAIGAGRAR